MPCSSSCSAPPRPSPPTSATRWTRCLLYTSDAADELAESRPAPPLAAEENKDLKRERNYPEQPPTIPHSIVGYRIDKDSNKCLSCHSRANSARTQAVMISITHYMDRDGQPLAAVSPRRYFCVQCHVPQQDVKPLVDNRFENIDQILEKEAANAARKP
ncbi:cytochrome C [Pseudomonas aeruginosa]|nr:cytochrome C [Pseudomonas aeruginosa]